MELELVPHVGVGRFRLGMSVGEARAAVEEWGVLRTVAGDEEPGQIVLTHDDSETDIVLGFGSGMLSGVELVRFRKEDADVRVLLDGLDVFRTPSEDLFEQLAERGHTIEENDLGFDALPELKVILANQSSYAYPVDEEGDPLYYDYVLVTTEPVV
ncbi:hypothetical protein [Streptomyces cinerochromogenes]|uniref:hypothetical protein n=1 Tax=Streptomyces cinerochromogenes TaxID=66422 RepID=UPI001671630F|nr:hypothetical protein [Streptomyces cinerochromogenes]GGS52363.1 hypothetical protein GCM10010206_12660 [Streptomyces cinerochromogenes]